MMDFSSILKRLPHRYPMLLVDRVVEVRPGQSLTAIKAIAASEYAYSGTFPAGTPDDGAYPLSLIVESFCQAAALLASVTKYPEPVLSPEPVPYLPLALLGGVYGCVFRGKAYPGDVLTHHVRLQKEYEDAVVCEGEVVVRREEIVRLDSVVISMKSVAFVRSVQERE